MLDIKFIRENQEVVKKAITDKALDLDLAKLLEVDEERRELITKIDALRKERKEVSQKRDVANGKKLKEGLGKLEGKLKKVEKDFNKLMLLVPNIPSKDTPIGGEEDYKVVEKWGRPVKFDFPVKDHVELGTSLGILDLERGVKVAGFRGYFLKDEGVLLHLGLLNLALRKLLKKGFSPMVTPTLVREFALVGSGHFPFGREEIYQVEEYSPELPPSPSLISAKGGSASGGKEGAKGEFKKDLKFLAGTAEPSLLAYHAGEVLREKDLPVKLCGISPCYRREVGGYGKDTKGIYRIHEFMKVEQVVLCRNDIAESEKWFLEMNENARELLRELELPHRVIQIATGDMGAGKYKMYDIETWMPARNGYGETHSNSNLTDWQSRRLNIRYQDRKVGKLQFVHAINNTMMASPRILIAILENNQQADGSVRIPKVLQEFVGHPVLSPPR